MNKITRDILQKIRDKKTLDIISKDLDIGKRTLKARVDSLVYQGYLYEIQYTSGCKACPMKCSTGTCSPNVKLYTLTEKGMDFINCFY